jgi:hypothetical protein
MKHDLPTGTWQDDTGCPISIILVSTSDAPFCLSGHHASGKKRDDQAQPHHTPEFSVEGDCAASTGG